MYIYKYCGINGKIHIDEFVTGSLLIIVQIDIPVLQNMFLRIFGSGYLRPCQLLADSASPLIDFGWIPNYLKIREKPDQWVDGNSHLGLEGFYSRFSISTRSNENRVQIEKQTEREGIEKFQSRNSRGFNSVRCSVKTTRYIELGLQSPAHWFVFLGRSMLYSIFNNSYLRVLPRTGRFG